MGDAFVGVEALAGDLSIGADDDRPDQGVGGNQAAALPGQLKRALEMPPVLIRHRYTSKRARTNASALNGSRSPTFSPMPM